MKYTAKSLYDKGVTTREDFLETARDNAAVTIPYLYPETDHEENEEFDAPYQSLGARGVNHLASQLLGVLFPTNQPFFRLSSDLGDEEDPGLIFRVDEALQKIERTILKDIDKKALRASLYNALRLLVVGGTVVISSLDNSFRVLRLNQFVVKRHQTKLSSTLFTEMLLQGRKLWSLLLKSVKTIGRNITTFTLFSIIMKTVVSRSVRRLRMSEL